MNFWYPCLVLIAVFWLSFAVVYFTLRGRMGRLERRLRRVERTLQGRQTEDFSTPQLQPRPQLPLTPRIKYVTVDRGIKPQWERQQH